MLSEPKRTGLFLSLMPSHLSHLRNPVAELDYEVKISGNFSYFWTSVNPSPSASGQVARPSGD